ncbi:MAG: elongation factor G [Pseudomonadota bacterium]
MARCVAVMGSPGTGKSTVVDQLSGLDGNAPPPPRQATEMRIVPFSYGGEAWTAIDCPGSIELLQQSVDALTAADAAIICVPPDPEAAVLSAPYLKAVEAAGTPALLFVNKIDAAAGRMRDIVAELQDYASHVIVLRQIPMREGEAIVGAVDLVSERAWRYREGERSALIEIPDGVVDREHEARDDLLEHLSDFDDTLLEQIVEDQAPAGDEIYEICSRVLQENRVIPALIGAAEHGNGMRRLMKALRHEVPGVETLRHRLGAGVGSPAPLSAVAFHGHHRRHVGRMVFLRALDDGIAAGAHLGNGTISTLLDPATSKPYPKESVEPGHVVAAVKSDHLASGHVFSNSSAIPAPAWAGPRRGQLVRILAPAHERDEVKLSTTLSRIAEDDRALGVGQDAETGAQRVEVQGPLHLRVLGEALNEIFGLATDVADVAPQYREAIGRTTHVHYRHRKQSGGAGQFADVKLTVAPNARGAGFLFEETVKGGAVPRNYIPAVETGAVEAMAKGPLGFPVVDLKVMLTDGQHHSVDSSDMAFRIAGRSGVQQALADAAPVLLQPIHEVCFHVPSVFTGALGPIVSTLRGQVLGFDRDPEAKGWDVFRALLPESALADLAGQLRGATQGVGWFDSNFDHYEEVFGKDADRISAERLSA